MNWHTAIVVFAAALVLNWDHSKRISWIWTLPSGIFIKIWLMKYFANTTDKLSDTQQWRMIRCKDHIRHEPDVWHTRQKNKTSPTSCCSFCFESPLNHVWRPTSFISTSPRPPRQQICAPCSKSFPSLTNCSLLEYWPDSRFSAPHRTHLHLCTQLITGWSWPCKLEGGRGSLINRPWQVEPCLGRVEVDFRLRRSRLLWFQVAESEWKCSFVSLFRLFSFLALSVVLHPLRSSLHHVLCFFCLLCTPGGLSFKHLEGGGVL